MSFKDISPQPSAAAAAAPSNVLALQLEIKKLKRELQYAEEDKIRARQLAEEEKSREVHRLLKEKEDLEDDLNALQIDDGVSTSEATAKLQSELEEAVRDKNQAIAERDKAIALKDEVLKRYNNMSEKYKTLKSRQTELDDFEQLQKNVKVFSERLRACFKHQAEEFNHQAEELNKMATRIMDDNAYAATLLNLSGLRLSRIPEKSAEGPSESHAGQRQFREYVIPSYSPGRVQDPPLIEGQLSVEPEAGTLKSEDRSSPRLETEGQPDRGPLTSSTPTPLHTSAEDDKQQIAQAPVSEKEKKRKHATSYAETARAEKKPKTVRDVAAGLSPEEEAWSKQDIQLGLQQPGAGVIFGSTLREDEYTFSDEGLEKLKKEQKAALMAKIMEARKKTAGAREAKAEGVPKPASSTPGESPSISTSGGQPPWFLSSSQPKGDGGM